MITVRTIISYPKKQKKTMTLKEKRAIAKARGRCGICITGRLQPGYKCCANCREKAKQY